MGVNVPVYDLRELLGTPQACAAEAVIVLDLPDRYAAVLVDFVCDARIAQSRLPVDCTAAGEAQAPVAWIAAWDAGAAPVLDITSCLHLRGTQRAD